jgi:hypothetical protein
MVAVLVYFVQGNAEALYFNHCCTGKAISITYSECVFVALVIQHAMRIRHIFTCGLCCSTIFFTHYLTDGKTLEKRF